MLNTAQIEDISKITYCLLIKYRINYALWEDIHHDTYVILLSKGAAEKWDPAKSTWGTYIYQCVHNSLRSVLKIKLDKTYESDCDSSEIDWGMFESSLVDTNMEDRIIMKVFFEKLLDSFSERNKDIIRKIVVDRWPLKDVAEKHGISLQRAHQIVHSFLKCAGEADREE